MGRKSIADKILERYEAEISMTYVRISTSSLLMTLKEENSKEFFKTLNVYSGRSTVFDSVLGLDRKRLDRCEGR